MNTKHSKAFLKVPKSDFESQLILPKNLSKNCILIQTKESLKSGKKVFRLNLVMLPKILSHGFMSLSAIGRSSYRSLVAMCGKD